MFDTNYVANVTEQNIRTIQRHIEKGILQAEKKGRFSYVSLKNLNEYIELIHSDDMKKHYKSKASNQSMKKEDVEFLEKFLEETKQCKSIEDLVLKFASMNIKIPSIDLFKRFQLHQEIIKDRKNKLSYTEIIEKHKVSSKTVYTVIKSAQEIKS